MIESIKNLFGLSRTFGMARSSGWNHVRYFYLEENPECAVCGRIGTILKPNEVHHILPFHIDPSFELDLSNLITLCRPHHYTFGHLDNWKSTNVDIVKDAQIWRVKIEKRP